MTRGFDLADSPLELVTAAANLVVSIADNKYFLARRLAAWGVGAPFLESAVACEAVAQEEAGHARGLYALLASFPAGTAPVPLEREDDRQRKYCLLHLRESSDSWYAAVASLVLVDRALTVVVAAAAASSFTELRKRALRILGDESFHRRYADGRVRELVDSVDEARVLEEHCAALLPETLCWFGPPDEPGMRSLVEAGVVDADGETMRQTFLAELGELQAQTGVELPIERVGEDRWSHMELPWSEWNSLERRLSSTRPAPIR